MTHRSGGGDSREASICARCQPGAQREASLSSESAAAPVSLQPTMPIRAGAIGAMLQYGKDVDFLTRLGYDRELCKQALEGASCDREQAQDLLLQWAGSPRPSGGRVSPLGATEEDDDGNVADDEDGPDDSPRTPRERGGNVIQAFGQSMVTKGPLAINIPNDIVKGGIKSRGGGSDDGSGSGSSAEWDLNKTADGLRHFVEALDAGQLVGSIPLVIVPKLPARSTVAATASGDGPLDAGEPELLAEVCQKMWEELTESQQAAASKLGYDPSSWQMVRTARPTTQSWGDLTMALQAAAGPSAALSELASNAFRHARR